MNRVLIALAALAFMTAPASADEQKDFFAQPSNEVGFKAALKSGELENGRARMVAMCEKEKAKNPSADCACVGRVVAAVSDREFYYESVRAYQEFMIRAEAFQAEDKQGYEALKAEHGKREGMVHKIEAQCGKV